MINEIIQKVSEIMELAVKVNSSETRQEITGYKPTFFVEFYGYSESPVIYLSGEGVTSRYDVTILDGAEKQTLQDLDTVFAEMRRFINEWEAAQ